MKIILAMLLFSTMVFAQNADSTAQAQGKIKIQAKQYNLEGDTVIYVDIDKDSHLSDDAESISFGVRFYDANNEYLGEKAISETVSNFFNLSSWIAYKNQKKTFVLNKWNLTEVGY